MCLYPNMSSETSHWTQAQPNKYSYIHHIWLSVTLKIIRAFNILTKGKFCVFPSY